MVKKTFVFIAIIIIFMISVFAAFTLGYERGRSNVKQSYEYLDVMEGEFDTLANLSANFWREAALNALLNQSRQSCPQLTEYHSRGYLPEEIFCKRYLIDSYKKALFVDAYRLLKNRNFPIDPSRRVVFWMKKMGYLSEKETFDVFPKIKEMIALLQAGLTQFEYVSDSTATQWWFYPGNYEKLKAFAERELSRRSDLENFIERTWDKDAE